MSERKGNTEEQNEFAENVKGEIIYILDAESGRKGYFCIGCKTQMQAVRTKIKDRKSYFRHDATDVQKNQRQCTFSNENYRHSQAISILNRIRRIKVPTLYKYAPKNSNGKTIKIRDSEFIEKKYTKSELTFYENDYGEVKYGRNPEIDNRNLLIRPDVTFFNLQNEPILLIEIVVTHKIDSEKLAKIKRLGIDTVQVTIPKDSLENIEKSFSIGQKIKWIHNNEQERTDYIYSPNYDTEGISQTDELQRKFFEESFECRKSQIKNLVRAITKGLESEQYKGIEGEFRQELQRIEINTKRTEKELEKYRDGIRRRVKREFKPRREGNKTERKNLDRKEEELNIFFRDNERTIKERSATLEERYIKRRTEIKERQREFSKSIREVEFFESTEKKYREEGERISEAITGIRKRKEDNIQIREQLPEKYQRLQNEQYQWNKQQIAKIQSEERGLPTLFEQKERELESKFERIRKSRIEQIKKSDNKGESEFSQRLKRILIARSVFNDWNERENTLKRNRTALECFRKGTYKNWN
tara:strand:- start:179 stop:1771 length:1593 start_codon:yes stop_codon:yes gene_type:complete